VVTGAGGAVPVLVLAALTFATCWSFCASPSGRLSMVGRAGPPV